MITERRPIKFRRCYKQTGCFRSRYGVLDWCLKLVKIINSRYHTVITLDIYIENKYNQTKRDKIMILNCILKSGRHSLGHHFLPRMVPGVFPDPCFIFLRDNSRLPCSSILHCAVCLSPSILPLSGVEVAIFVFFGGRILNGTQAN